MTEDEYPSWRKALFGNGHVANLKCAGKYGFWHGLYAVIAVLMFVVYGLCRVWDAIMSVGVSREGDSGPSWLIEKMRSEKFKDAVAAVILVFGFGWILTVMGALIYAFIQEPVQMAIDVAIVLGVVILLVIIAVSVIFAGTFIWNLFERGAEKYGPTVTMKASAVSKTAKATKGVRRVYGRCPVSFDIEPKWFQKLVDEEENQ